MALKVPVKVSGVSNLSDARYCAGMGVHWLGFSIKPDGPNYCSPEQFQEIASWVEGVSHVAEAHDMSIEAIEAAVAQYAVQVIEVNQVEVIMALPATDLPIFYSIELNAHTNIAELTTTMEQVSHRVAHFVVQGEAPQPLVQEVLQLASHFPILLGSGIEAETVEATIDQHAVKGLALRGSDEIKPGYKDYDGLAEVFEAIEKEEWE